jgi:hypothetical protein
MNEITKNRYRDNHSYYLWKSFVIEVDRKTENCFFYPREPYWLMGKGKEVYKHPKTEEQIGIQIAK